MIVRPATRQRRRRAPANAWLRLLVFALPVAAAVVYLKLPMLLRHGAYTVKIYDNTPWLADGLQDHPGPFLRSFDYKVIRDGEVWAAGGLCQMDWDVKPKFKLVMPAGARVMAIVHEAAPDVVIGLFYAPRARSGHGMPSDLFAAFQKATPDMAYLRLGELRPDGSDPLPHVRGPSGW